MRSSGFGENLYRAMVSLGKGNNIVMWQQSPRLRIMIYIRIHWIIKYPDSIASIIGQFHSYIFVSQATREAIHISTKASINRSINHLT